MIAVAEGRKVIRGSFRRVLTGIRLTHLTIDQNDIREIANMSDRDLVATMRQLDARCNRPPYRRPSGEAVQDTKGVVVPLGETS